MLATIGYERSTQEDFITTLRCQEIQVLVDIRERAQSRRPGFSKTALSLAVNSVGIEYIHIKALGDPKEGRDAARAGLIEEFQKIFGEVMAGDTAQAALADVAELAKSRRVCLMCYESDHKYCHRKIVSDHLEDVFGLNAIHLEVIKNESISRGKGRVFHSRQSATA